jgi:hypothetical protein
MQCRTATGRLVALHAWMNHPQDYVKLPRPCRHAGSLADAPLHTSRGGIPEVPSGVLQEVGAKTPFAVLFNLLLSYSRPMMTMYG